MVGGSTWRSQGTDLFFSCARLLAFRYDDSELSG